MNSIGPDHGVDIDHILKAEIFTGLDEKDLQKILPICEQEMLPKGTIICREGDLAEKIYILQKGRIQINLRNKTSFEIVEPGRILGWSALVIYNKYYTATATSMEDSLCIRITASDMLALFRDDHLLGLKVMNNLSEVIARRLANIVEHY
jgi:CRP-like cAMP-binding protein